MVIDAIHAQRVATIAELRRERVEAMAQFEGFAEQMLDRSVGRAEGLIDYVLWRVAVLLGDVSLFSKHQ